MARCYPHDLLAKEASSLCSRILVSSLTVSPLGPGWLQEQRR